MEEKEKVLQEKIKELDERKKVVQKEMRKRIDLIVDEQIKLKAKVYDLVYNSKK